MRHFFYHQNTLSQVKVDAKTKNLLDDYKRAKKERESKEENGKDKDEDTDGEVDDEKSVGGLEDLDEFTMREDRVAQAGLDAIMREYAEDLAKEPPQDESKEDKKEKKKNKEKLPEKDAVCNFD